MQKRSEVWRSVTPPALPPLQGYLAHKKHPPPEDYHRSLGIGLQQGHTGGLFLMSEVPSIETSAVPEVLRSVFKSVGSGVRGEG